MVAMIALMVGEEAHVEHAGPLRPEPGFRCRSVFTSLRSRKIGEKDVPGVATITCAPFFEGQQVGRCSLRSADHDGLRECLLPSASLRSVFFDLDGEFARGT